MELKAQIKTHYRELLQQKTALLAQQLQSLAESLHQETKSTAGDKYETARAMLHIEQENLQQQMAVLKSQQAALDYESAAAPGRAGPGSLVTTDKGVFFISASLGKASIAGHTVYALSPQSPLGQKLLQHGIGDTIVQQQTAYTITGIY